MYIYTAFLFTVPINTDSNESYEYIADQELPYETEFDEYLLVGSIIS